MYSGITSGRVLSGELLYTKILEVNLFAFAYRLFRRDFSPLDGIYCMDLGYLYLKAQYQKCITVLQFMQSLFTNLCFSYHSQVDSVTMDGPYITTVVTVCSLHR